MKKCVLAVQWATQAARFKRRKGMKELSFFTESPKKQKSEDSSFVKILYLLATLIHFLMQSWMD